MDLTKTDGHSSAHVFMEASNGLLQSPVPHVLTSDTDSDTSELLRFDKPRASSLPAHIERVLDACQAATLLPGTSIQEHALQLIHEQVLFPANTCPAMLLAWLLEWSADFACSLLHGLLPNSSIDMQSSQQDDDTPQELEDTFFMVDLGMLHRLHSYFVAALPRVTPFYAVKCMPEKASLLCACSAHPRTVHSVYSALMLHRYAHPLAHNTRSHKMHASRPSPVFSAAVLW